jgi:hypothetical protein
VSGIATVTRERQKICELYVPDWKIWFPDEGTPATAHPRLVLIGVDVQFAVFLEVSKSTPAVLFEMAKGWATGEMPEIGKVRALADPLAVFRLHDGY